jgi:hypothetical protein
VTAMAPLAPAFQTLGLVKTVLEIMPIVLFDQGNDGESVPMCSLGGSG